YGLITHALIASTAATATTIVTTQSMIVGHGPGSDSSLLWRKTAPYRSPMRMSGQYTANTGPIRSSLETGPHFRLSHDCPRLSPIMKYSSAPSVRSGKLDRPGCPSRQG